MTSSLSTLSISFRNTCCTLMLLFAAGCKLHKVQAPAPLATPASFTASADGASTDTVSTPVMPWATFFTDAQLTALIGEALRSNPDLNIALQRIEMARAQSWTRRGALLPSINAVATAGQRKFGEYTMDGIGNYDTNFSDNIGEDKHIAEHLPDYFLGLQSTWEIDVWSKLRNQKKAAFARLLSNEQGRRWITTGLVAEVAMRYYELLTLDSELAIIQENISLQEKAVEVMTIQKQAGRATQLAVEQFTAQLLNTRSREGGIRQNIVKTETEMNTLLGRFSQPILRGNSILQQQLPPQVHSGIPAQVLRRRPDVQQTALAWMAAQADQRAAHAAFFPALTINSSVGLQAFNTAFLFSTPGSIAYNVLGGLSAPLFDRHRIRADYKAATAFQKEEFYNYQKTVLTAFQEVVYNLNQIQNLQSVSALKEQEVTVLQNAVTTANDLFVTGYASYLEVIAAQKGVLEAELALANTRKEQFHAVISLYKSLGGGWD